MKCIKISPQLLSVLLFNLCLVSKLNYLLNSEWTIKIQH